jgi:hypothetical protein
MATDWKVATPSLGYPKIDTVDDSALVPLGSIVRAVHPTHGEGEFIYLKGVANVDAGDWVEYNDTFGTAIASIALNTPDLLAIAMAAVVADKYGWFQISGRATALKAEGVSIPVGALGVTAGLCVAAASALLVQGAIFTSIASAVSVTGNNEGVIVLISRPSGPISD